MTSHANGDPQTSEFLSGALLWEQIQELSRNAVGPKRVATAYIGNDAGKKIKLGSGDRLLVALSEANVKNGTVSPFELERLKNLGVDVFAEPTLHAKVYHFGNAAVVGSANLSKNSGSLQEAAAAFYNSAQLDRIRDWFDSACTTVVTDAQLDRLKSIFAGSRGGRDASQGDHTQPRLWLVGIGDIDFPERENDEYLAGERRAKLNLTTGGELEALRFATRSKFAREVKVDDLLIQVYREGRTLQVYPHAVVLETTRIEDEQVLYVYIQEFEAPALRWTEFRKQMAKVGLKLGQDVGTMLVKKPAALARAKELTRGPTHHPL